MPHYAEVILPLSISRTYTYVIPDDILSEVSIGKRVVVQFGSKKFYAAVVCAIHQTSPKEYTAKPIEYVLDEQPCVLEYQIQFWKWLSEYYLSKIGDVMNAALPSGLKIESVSHIQINSAYVIDNAALAQMDEKEKKVIEILVHQRKMQISALEKIIPKYRIPKVIKNLSEKGLIFFSEEVEEKYKPKLSAYVELNSIYKDKDKLQALIQQLEKRAFKQLEALLAWLHLSKQQSLIKKSVLLERCSASSVKALIDKKIFIEHWIEESRLQSAEVEKNERILTSIQKQAVQNIHQVWQSKQTCLLYGETGSGKTEIYIELMKEQVTQGKQVLYLVPEIALTTQLIQRLKKVFGNQVYVYHSRFSENERTEVWNKLLQFELESQQPLQKEKAAHIIIGPRSALFLPFKYLGLVIIDEEHDASFKQRQKHPYYNARDAAIYLGYMLKVPVLLGSATPSIESLYHAHSGKYGLVRLKKKYGTARVSRKLIDIRKYYHQMQGQTMISPPLFEAIKERLHRKEQVLIFHNRRGYVPITQCMSCGWVAKCKNCDVSVVYHKQHNVLLCHYCGDMQDLIRVCPACGSTQINYKGWGTEKIEEELVRLFPQYTIARMDQDTTRSKFAHKNIIDAFEHQEIDILIGTQMISKGLDFKNVTLVAVLHADSLLHLPEYRAFEKAFQLLYQLSGRAGRMSKDGEILVQTFQPENRILQMYLENDYDKFYNEILNERKYYQYPPYSKLCNLVVKSKQEEDSARTANALYKFLYPYFREHLLGPIKPYISKLNNYYLHQILIKIPLNYSYQKAKQIIYQNIQKVQSSATRVDVIVDA